MKTNKVGLGVTAVMAIFLAVATTAYACTVSAGAPDHDFQVVPAGGDNNAPVVGGTPVVARGHCTYTFNGCSLGTVGPNTISIDYVGPCSFVPGATNPCPSVSPVGHAHSSPCASTWPTSGNLGSGTQTRTDAATGQKVHTVEMGATPAPNVVGTYMVCSSFEPDILWNYLTLV